MRAIPRRTAVILAAVCATGISAGLSACGVLAAPSAPAGLEKQIVAGERVSSATQAHGMRPATKDALSSAPNQVPGRDVTAIGDSVMAVSATALESVLPGIYINAKIDREMPDGLAIVRRLAASGELRPVVVVGLGTNWTVSTAQLQELLQLIGPHRRLVLVNTWRPDDGWSLDTNAREAAFARQHPGVVVADWYDLIKGRQYLLWPDHVHPEGPGTFVYAHLLDQAIQETRGTARVPAPAVSAPPPASRA
jgi:hypothetical protein